MAKKGPGWSPFRVTVDGKHEFANSEKELHKLLDLAEMVAQKAIYVNFWNPLVEAYDSEDPYGDLSKDLVARVEGLRGRYGNKDSYSM